VVKLFPEGTNSDTNCWITEGGEGGESVIQHTKPVVFAKDNKFDSIMIKVHLRALEGYLHTSEVEKDEDS
jgi:hypothetical protein